MVLHAETSWSPTSTLSPDLSRSKNLCITSIFLCRLKNCCPCDWATVDFFFLPKTLNSRLRKTHGKKGIEKMWKKTWDGLPSSPKLIKTRRPSLRDPGNIHHPHFLKTLGGIFTSCVPSYGRYERQLRWAASTDCQLDHLHLSRSIDRRYRLDWAHAELDHLLRDHVRERCGRRQG